MTPYYSQDGITIFHGDCLEVLAGMDNPRFDAVIADPPYGMNWNTDTTRFSGGDQRRGRGRGDWGDIVNDDCPFDPAPWLQYPHVILWGCNHFAQRLPVGTTLVWIKKGEHLYGTFLSDAELAWMKGGHGVYVFTKRFATQARANEGGGRCLHPNQKPIALMEWCIEKCKVPAAGVLLDPFMGVGTTLVAARNLGRRAVGIEIEERYCRAAVERLRQRSLWAVAELQPAPLLPVQDALFPVAAET